MTTYLVIFMDSLTDVRKEDHSLISGYRASKVHIVPYEYTAEALDGLEKQLTTRGMNVTYIRASRTEDRDRINSDIRDILYQKDCEELIIDITEASSYHVAVCMNLGDSDRVEVIYRRKDGDVTVPERMNDPKHIYNVLTDKQMSVIDVLTVYPMLEKEIKEECRKRGNSVSDTTIYDTLSYMQNLGLVMRGAGTPAENYKSKKQKFFCMSEKQLWDYWNYRRQYLKKKSEKEVFIAKAAERSRAKKRSKRKG